MFDCGNIKVHDFINLADAWSNKENNNSGADADSAAEVPSDKENGGFDGLADESHRQSCFLNQYAH